MVGGGLLHGRCHIVLRHDIIDSFLGSGYSALVETRHGDSLEEEAIGNRYQYES